MIEKEINKEILSALVDGQLRGEELEQALACTESEEGYTSWELYHLIGDVLRSPDLAHHSQHDLLTGLRQQIAAEGVLYLEPSDLRQVATPMTVQSNVVVLHDPAANSSVFRWKVVASFASVAAVAALGWNLLSPTEMTAAQLAEVQNTVPTPVLVVTQDGNVLRDPRLDTLLANQQQYASRAALQPPADFLRNAGFEQARNGRYTPSK